MAVRVLPAVLLTALLAALAAPGSAGAMTLRPCSGQGGFGCGVLRVPLDRSGGVRGTVGLRVAVQDTRAARAKPRLLVALSGGPGQSGVPAASQFASTLAPLLRDHRLVTLDQRGTGASGALDCPNLQRLDGLDPFTPAAVRSCARRVGPRRRAFTTQDTVADVEALRRALGAPKLALMGVSYGTHVAQQYARTHPDRTARLVLDSPVAPGGVDPFLLDTHERLPRVLRDQCAGIRCRGITQDPVADLAALVPRLAAGTLRGRTFDARGRARTASFRTGEELFFALVAADLNPYLQAALPSALAAARAGDAAPLVRLRPSAAGVGSRRRELSAGLNVVTSCQDVRLPYALDSPLAARPALADAALAALDPARYAPWDAATVRSASYVEDCLGYPDTGAAQASGPLPAVPTLVLSGRLDLRTPLENGEAIAAEVPGTQQVLVPGTGHDVLDTDATGCADLALERWARGRAVGTPCATRTNAVDPLPLPPRALSAYAAPAGVAGNRGRVLLAVLDTVQDARLTLLQRLFAGLGGAGGGLRGGRFAATEDLGALRLADYAYVPGLRVTGRLTAEERGLRGRLVVRAPGGLGGVLQVSAGGASGTLGGRAVRYRERPARAASPPRREPRLAPRAASVCATPARVAGAVGARGITRAARAAVSRSCAPSA